MLGGGGAETDNAKSTFKFGIRKNAQYPSDELFHEMDVLSLRQIFVKSLFVFMYNSSDSLFNPVTHAHSTKLSTAFGIITPRITKTYACTSSY